MAPDTVAILIDFVKTREDEATVEYRFGPPEDFNRQLVIRKETQEAAPSDGRVDGDFHAVLRKIAEYYGSRASWPDSGSYAA